MTRSKFHIPVPTEQAVGLSMNGGPTVSVSLKHWRAELVRLRKLIEKIQNLTVAGVRNDAGLQWKLHKGPTARGFSRPQSLSKDIDLCELRVDGKARVHGAFLNDVFYLVWLDRTHGVFPNT